MSLDRPSATGESRTHHFTRSVVWVDLELLPHRRLVRSLNNHEPPLRLLESVRIGRQRALGEEATRSNYKHQDDDA